MAVIRFAPTTRPGSAPAAAARPGGSTAVLLALYLLAGTVGLLLGSTVERVAAVLLLVAGTIRLAARHGAAGRRNVELR